MSRTGYKKFKEEDPPLDFVINVGESYYDAHKAILAAHSDYFMAMFSHEDMVENRDGQVSLRNIEPDIFELILDYCYTSKITLTSDNITAILSGASRFLMRGLLQACDVSRSKINSITSSNCLELLDMAIREDLKHIKKYALERCQSYFDKICKGDQFLRYNEEVIENIFKVVYKDHESKLNTLMRWVSFEPTERASHLDKLLLLIRLEQVCPLRLMEAYENPIVMQSETCVKTFDKAFRLYAVSRAEADEAIKKRQHG